MINTLKINIILISLFLLYSSTTKSQSLLDLLDSVETKPTYYIENTFKAIRLINGYTSDIAGKKDLIFSISHRFGSVEEGINQLYGLDNSTIRFGFEYGISNKISLGIGRSSGYDKLYDGFIKYKITRQSNGGKSFPLTITWLSGMSVITYGYDETVNSYPFSSRLNYVHEVFIARKFSDTFSAQLVPVVVPRHMVKTQDEQNIVSAIGTGANYTVNHWLSFSGEYYYLLPGNTADNYSNSLSVSMEMETGGGHIFQISLSNSSGMTEKHFVPETTGRWLDGDIALGFNIIRIFHTKKKSKR